LKTFKSNSQFKSLPSLNADAGFLEIKDYLEHPMWEIIEPATPQDILNCSIESIFHLSLHSVIRRKWDTKHKIPSPYKETKKMAESIGEFLFELLLLCQECSLFADATKTDVPTGKAWEWFTVIYWEIKHASFNAPKNQVGKRDSITQTRKKIISPLENKINPIDENKQKNLKLLFDVCITQAKVSDRFRNKHWNPFLRKYKSFLSNQQNDNRIIRINIDDKGIYYYSGQGKHRKRIS
jgi:hypothetical protein